MIDGTALSNKSGGMMKHLLIWALIFFTHMHTVAHDTVKDIFELLKQYAQPYKSFRAIESICFELNSDIEVLRRTSNGIALINEPHLHMQMQILQNSVDQLKVNKEELCTYLYEDLDYLRNLICGMIVKYRELNDEDRSLFNEELHQLLHTSKKQMDEIITNHDEIII